MGHPGVADSAGRTISREEEENGRSTELYIKITTFLIKITSRSRPRSHKVLASFLIFQSRSQDHVVSVASVVVVARFDFELAGRRAARLV